MDAPSATTPLAEADGSHHLLRLVFDHAGEGISVFDAALRLLAWNERFVSLTGLDLALMHAGMGLYEVLLSLAQAGEYGEVDAPAEAARRVALISDPSNSGPMQHLRPNGRSIELRRSPTPDGGFVLLCADITERKAAEAAAADNQRMLSLLLQRTQQGFWFIDNALLTTDANPAMCRMLGLTLAELMGRSIYEFVDEANEAIFKRQVALRAQGRAEGYEITLRRADGGPVHCYNNATPVFDAEGRKTGAVGMFSDISQQKRAEQQIRHTSELLAEKTRVLEATLDSLSQGVLSLDAQGRTNTFNLRFVELLEIPESLMRTRPTLEELTQYQLAQGHFGQGLSNVSDSGRPGLARYLTGDANSLAPRYQRTRRDGTVLDVQTHVGDDGSVVRTYTDVTASVQAQQALRESENRFRTMADGAPALIWQSSANGTPMWFNQRWLEYTGRNMEEELACAWADRMHPDDLQRCRSSFALWTQRQQAYDIEFRLRRADGGWGWIADTGIPRFGSDGRFEGYISYGWEITERKAAEAALIAAKEEAERANRAKSEFLSRMSHELRTPLNAVLGFGQLLAADPRDPLSATQRVRVQELLRGGRHLLSLINEVLDLASIEAGTLHLHLAPVDLGAVVDDCLRLVRPMADERQIQLDVLPGEPEARIVLADPTRLKQVLLNLLSNAIKYNFEGGGVQLAWELEPGTADREDGREDSVRIEVRDNGPGLTDAQKERLFQAFDRLDAGRSGVEGTGIGLALSKWLVELMRGEIGVRSAPRLGSTFWLRLARSDGPAAHTGAMPLDALPTEPGSWPGALLPSSALATAPMPLGPRAAPTAATPRRTVLYIEDNPVNQLLMEGMLSQRPGLRLLIAGLPAEGLAMAAQAGPDLVLLDIQLPGMDGFEVLRRLRQQPQNRSVPVIAVSANAMPTDIDEAARAGFSDYVVKPLDMARLLASVDRILDSSTVPSLGT